MKLSNILRNIFWIFTALLAGFVLFLLLSGTKCFAVQSESMSPTLHRGDAVFVRKADFSQLHEGDIVSAYFPESDGVFTHRIQTIDTQKQQITTRGDANMSDDPAPTQAEKIIGKLWFSVPAVGFLSLYLQNRTVVILLLIAVFVLIALRAFLEFRKKEENR